MAKISKKAAAERYRINIYAYYQKHRIWRECVDEDGKVDTDCVEAILRKKERKKEVKYHAYLLIDRMRKEGMKNIDLAKIIGCSPAAVSQSSAERMTTNNGIGYEKAKFFLGLFRKKYLALMEEYDMEPLL